VRSPGRLREKQPSAFFLDAAKRNTLAVPRGTIAHWMELGEKEPLRDAVPLRGARGGGGMQK
jgi:hypothetical protein